MSKNKFNNDIYNMYEKETLKNEKLTLKCEKLMWKVEELRYDNKKLNKKLYNINSIKEKEIIKEVEKITKPIIIENQKLKEELSNALDEINRLKSIINNDCNDKDYLIDKLNNQVHKDSSNSSIPTSKEIKNKNRINQYNHRTPSAKITGGQMNHQGSTLTKEKVENIINMNNLEVREIKHYVDIKKYKGTINKYRVGIEIKTYIEKHIFMPSKKSKEKLPREFYSDVTYNDDLKMIIVSLGNYFAIPYNKIKELLYDLTNGIINISEGTIDNIYEDFSNKTDDTLNNITNNLLNGTYQHTDETNTKENGKDTYYRGYANCKNVLYKYHHHKGDKPIEEDGILTNYYGTIISDHDTGIFKYGTNNQDCIIHFGRYCIEKEQNIGNIFWPMDLYRLLLKFERNRKIVSKFGGDKFSSEEIEVMEKEYDDILEIAEEENKKISSTYWKEKTETLLKRCIKYKRTMLFYIYDFSVPYDNNSIERALRMVKGKTKVSGGFRSDNGGKRFGRIMSVIKTAKLRKLKPFECIQSIYDGKVLFA